MKTSPRKIAAVALIWLQLAAPGAALPGEKAGDAPPIVSLAVIEKEAQKRTDAKPRVALAPVDAPVFTAGERFEPLGTGEIPNYLRALAALPKAVRPFAELVQAALYKGQVAPELKMAMGLRVAQINNSPYVAAHMLRLLRADERGRRMLAQVENNSPRGADALAFVYAESLTRDINGVSDADFQKTRGAFNDSQIVELTMTVAFFNYFTRLAEALRLPVEPWALAASAGQTRAATSSYQPPPARVGLISNEEIRAVGETVAAAKDPARQAGGLGLGVANSQRAMMRAPEFGLAWRAYGNAVREYATVNREMKLHVSFAVSMANGCRYCTLHQVLGLRRVGVDPAKLVAMKKDDAALSPRELTAVNFARKLTREPSGVGDADFAALQAEFAEQGALEVLLQTCAFSFMNRFTDALRLPSEDEAIKTYQETYGSDYSRR